jgi:hypothetical protein
MIGVGVAVAALALLWVGSSVAAEEVGPMSARSPEARLALAPQLVPTGGPGALAWGTETPIPGGLVRYAHCQDPTDLTTFYVFGGVDGTASTVANSWRYDAATDTWTPLAAMPYASEGPVAACDAGKVYVAGGGGTTNFNVYDIATDMWTPLAALPRAMWGAAMGTWNGQVFMIGGDSDFSFGGTSNQVNIYSIGTDTWTGTGTAMPAAAVTSFNAQSGPYVYVVGGWGDASPGTNVNASQRYNMDTDTWEAGPTFTSARADGALIVTSATLYAVGGDANGGGAFDATNMAEVLVVADWTTGSWGPDTSLPVAYTANSAGYCTQDAMGSTGYSLGGYNGSILGTLYSSPVEPCIALPPVAEGLGIDDSGGNGNGVLDPLETAAIQPAWSSATGLTGVTGLGAAVGDYTLSDDTADYGDIAAGTTVSCTATGDCYEVIADGSRPGTHWDVTLQETLNTTDTHDWVLHIGESFTDVATSHAFYRFIETIFHNGVTGGCTTDSYCPNVLTTRGQMSVFVLTAFEGSGYTPPACVAGSELFGDVPATNPFCAHIEELANRGVVSGCGGGNFCPDSPVTREQMPIFCLLTLEGSGYDPPDCVAGSELFGDVPATSPYCEWIEEFANRGITGGCGGGNYCPNNGTTRGQMAVFQTATFDLMLYQP